jgi:hypothetical protein
VFEGTVFEAYPYLLPNLVCTIVVICGLGIGILFLEETHEDMKYDRDRGRELGNWILCKFRGEKGYVLLSEKDESFDELRAMLGGDGSRAYDSTTSSPTLCSTRASMTGIPPYSLERERPATLKIRELFSRQVCLNIIAVGILAL